MSTVCILIISGTSAVGLIGLVFCGTCWYMNHRLLQVNDSVQSSIRQLRAEGRRNAGRLYFWRNEYQRAHAAKNKAQIAYDDTKIQIYSLQEQLRRKTTQLEILQEAHTSSKKSAEMKG